MATTATVHLASSFVGIRIGLPRRLSSSAYASSSSRNNPRAMSKTTITAKLSRRGVVVPLLALVAATTATATPAAAQDQQGYTTSASGLEYCDTMVGTGESIAKGALIKVHYTGTLEDGTVFDSSYKRGKPLSFNVGVGQVIRGWDEGILGGSDVPPMLTGGKRKLRIPPKLGYGERGAGCRGKSCVIPPNSVLLFDVELVGKGYK
ncbi:peptidyl-prolyl cis-trans isomerase FKBP13, chloroplastic [Selaginella moellendorffii]|nr:peptidyl-prolyl cis-trans isomerase FKBP13, chloroplastic [Selaginella moellendorffii]|eukprot:XP_002987087.2 peptidyl-prolyl cis-trans isomerase FKBP13, chloroplastic [Selaginella moellendorffii]